MVEGLKPPVRWMRMYFEDDEILFYFEFDEDGWVLRQVEFEGPMRVPTTAASLAERPDPETDGLDAVRAYIARWGDLGDQPLPNDVDLPHDDISAEEIRRRLAKGQGQP